MYGVKRAEIPAFGEGRKQGPVPGCQTGLSALQNHFCMLHCKTRNVSDLLS